VKKNRAVSQPAPKAGPRVLYFATEYPRATDTFIQREIAALRSHGVVVESMAARSPDDQHVVGEEQRLERDRTRYILPPSVGSLLKDHLGLVTRSPGRYVRALKLALRTARPGIRGHLFQLFYFAEAGAVAARLRDEEFDHLHSHFGDVSTSIAMLASELAGVRFSFTLHGPGVFFEAHTWRLDTKIERAAFVSCISWFCRSQAQLLSSEESGPKLHIVHCGVDVNRYVDRSAEEARPLGTSGPIRLAFVGRLDHVKGLTVLFEALAEVAKSRPEVHLEVAGDGPKRRDFERAAARMALSDRVKFLGYVSQSEVADLLARSDIYVLPSFAEGVPVVLMEAQASGLPAVATKVGGVGELVLNNKTGFLVSPGDVLELAARIDQLAGDPEMRQRFGAAGRAKVTAEFASKTEAGRLAALFAAPGSTAFLGIRPNSAAAGDLNDPVLPHVSPY